MLERSVFNLIGKNKLSILIYHRVLADGEFGFGDPTESEFRQQMGNLQKHFNVLTLREAVTALSTRTLPSRAAVVTFDDGYRDNYSRALPILKSHGLRATFFIATDYLDGGTMWNDKITYSVLNSPLDRIDLSRFGLGAVSLDSPQQRLNIVRQLLSNVKHLDMQDREVAADLIVDDAKGVIPDNLMMTSDELKAMAHADMEIGGHTRSHPILGKIDDESAIKEIQGGKQDIEQILGNEITSFAYPNGKPSQDYFKRHSDIVKNAGFKCAVSTAWGVSNVQTDLYQLPRFTPWDKTPVKFRLRLYKNLFNTHNKRSNEMLEN